MIILGNRDEKFRALAHNAPEGKQVVDLVGSCSKATSVSGRTRRYLLVTATASFQAASGFIPSACSLKLSCHLADDAYVQVETCLLQSAGWLFFLSLLMGLALALPNTFDRRVEKFYFPDWCRGYLALLDQATHFLARHAVSYTSVYPHLRRKVRKLGKAADPSHVFLMVTSFRIDALTTAQVYSSVIREAHRLRPAHHRGVLAGGDVR